MLEYDDKDEAIRAALDELEPGGTLTVHEQYCVTGFMGPGMCSCNPKTWTYGGNSERT